MAVFPLDGSSISIDGTNTLSASGDKLNVLSTNGDSGFPANCVGAQHRDGNQVAVRFTDVAVRGRDVDLPDPYPTDVATIVYDVGDPQAGTVTFLDGSTLRFSQIESVIPCFTPGTLIATPLGERPVEALRVGDPVQTRDNGIQTIVWAGQKTVSRANLAVAPDLRPVRIKAGALGQGLPERDMLVSPNHRMLIVSERAGLYFEQSEVLVAAKHLIGRPGIDVVNVAGITYVHFMFANHEVVLSDGAWSESFQPRDYTLQGVDDAQRQEIFALFPELETPQGLLDYPAARRSLAQSESALLFQ